MKTYKIKDIFYTVQGEGFWAGTPSVFVRFSGCNLWTGKSEDRQSGPGSCSVWCDTDFLVGENLSVDQIFDRVWDCDTSKCFHIVFTGGEPSLQLDEEISKTFNRFAKHVETNGTVQLKGNYDWVTVSPKKGGQIVQRRIDEVKIVYPTEINPLDYNDLSECRFLSPLNGSKENTRKCIEFAKNNPEWRVSARIHQTGGVK